MEFGLCYNTCFVNIYQVESVHGEHAGDGDWNGRLEVLLLEVECGLGQASQARRRDERRQDVQEVPQTQIYSFCPVSILTHLGKP